MNSLNLRQRITGLIKTKDQDAFYRAVIDLKNDLRSEGFDDEEIKQFLKDEIDNLF